MIEIDNEFKRLDTPIGAIVGEDCVIESHVVVDPGKIIGVYENLSFQEAVIPAARDDKLLIFSDGIYEEFNDSNEEYGENRLKALFSLYNDRWIAQVGTPGLRILIR